MVSARSPRRFDALVVGLICADIIVRPFDELPAPGTSGEAETIEIAVGGGATNTSRVLANLGRRVALAGLVGADNLGDLIRVAVERTGVDITYLHDREGVPTSATLVVVSSDAERSFVQRVGSNQVLSLDDLPDLPWTEARVLHVGGCMKVKSLDLGGLLARAKSYGLLTSLDTDWDMFGAWWQRVAGALPHTDLFMTNEAEGQMLTGETAPSAMAGVLRAAGAGTVVIKRGKQGCYVEGPDGGFSVPAFEVPAVDTTGAGDAFAAGFLCGILAGWPLEHTARFASAIGASCVMAIGTVAGIPSLDWSAGSHKAIAQIESFLRRL